jgi:hypothetical protein
MRVCTITSLLPLVVVTVSAPIIDARAQSPLTAVAGRCSTDDEVPAKERALYEKSAMRIVETLIGDKPEEAYAALVSSTAIANPRPPWSLAGSSSSACDR